jgi:hypothetical protein
MTDRLIKCKPAVKKEYLIMFAGVMWWSVGVMLIVFASTWLSRYAGTDKFYFYGAGFLVALPIHHFGFLRLADKNINRLLALTGKNCLFSFITLKSYFIIIIMVAMGIFLRHSAIPKQYLSIVYNGIGLGLFLSGIRYVRSSVEIMHARQ